MNRKMKSMKYEVSVVESEEGFSVSRPALAGCWLQGNTKGEAIENITVAIREYLLAVQFRYAKPDNRNPAN